MGNNQSGQNTGERTYTKTRLSKSLSEITECVIVQSLQTATWIYFGPLSCQTEAEYSYSGMDQKKDIVIFFLLYYIYLFNIMLTLYMLSTVLSDL